MQSTGLNYLAKILEENRYAEFLSTPAKYFSIEIEKDCYKFIEKYVKKHGQLPSLKLAIEKTELKPVSTKDTFEFFQEDFFNRTVYSAFDRMLPTIQKHLVKKDIPQALQLLTEFLEKSQDLQASDGVVRMETIGEKLLSFISKARESETGMVGIPTPWETLNRFTGGLQGGDVVLILARPKLGKSLTMLLMADTAYTTDFDPLLVSMEMTDLQMGKRFFAKKAGLNMTMIRDGLVTSEGEERIQRVIDDMKTQHPFYFVEGQFRKDVRDVAGLIHKFKPHVVFIDGGYLMHMIGTERLAKHEKMAEIAIFIKTTAMKFNIPIVVSFQFTRQLKGHQKEKAGLEHIQLSDAIGQIASLGIGIFDDESERTGSRITRKYIEIVGQREGEGTGFWINWDWKRMDFREIVELGTERE